MDIKQENAELLLHSRLDSKIIFIVQRPTFHEIKLSNNLFRTEEFLNHSTSCIKVE